jgi:ATP-dependent Clp protease ATP-binding subunit ClpA
MAKVLQNATKIMKNQNDTFLAIDHLIVALAEEPSIVTMLKEAGTDGEKIKRAAQQGPLCFRFPQDEL